MRVRTMRFGGWTALAALSVLTGLSCGSTPSDSGPNAQGSGGGSAGMSGASGAGASAGSAGQTSGTGGGGTAGATLDDGSVPPLDGAAGSADVERPDAGTEEPLPTQSEYLKTLYALCDLLISTQITGFGAPNYGALVSPSTN